MIGLTVGRAGLVCGVVGLLVLGVSSAGAGERVFRRGPVVVPTARAVANPPHGTLGTFYPTPYLFVRGNGPAGGGYSPLGSFGDATMTMYGPISSLRMTSAPVLTYARGYDGRPVAVEATSFSAPNLPALTPVVFPTQASYYYGFRHSGAPPWWANAINWIDQN